MKKTRFSRAFVVLPVLVAVGAAAMVWRRNQPVAFIDLPSSNVINSLEFSPDGKRLVAFSSEHISTPQSGRIYDVKTGAKLLELETPPSTAPAPQRSGFLFNESWPTWSPDGSQLVSDYQEMWPAINTGKLMQSYNFVIWDAATGQVKVSGQPQPVKEWRGGTRKFYSTDGKTLHDVGPQAAIFDAVTGKTLKSFKSHTPDAKGKIARHVKINDNLKLAAETMDDQTGGRESEVRVFDNVTGKLLWQPSIKSIRELNWYGDILLVLDHGTKAQQQQHKCPTLLWDGKTRQPISSPPPGATSVKLNPTNSTMASFYTKVGPTGPRWTNELVIWDYQRQRQVAKFFESSTLSNQIWSPDGQRLALLSTRQKANQKTNQRDLLILDQNGNLLLRRPTDERMLHWSPDSRQIVAVDKLPNQGLRLNVVQVS